jgi:hypothetical protein
MALILVPVLVVMIFYHFVNKRGSIGTKFKSKRFFVLTLMLLLDLIQFISHTFELNSSFKVQ